MMKKNYIKPTLERIDCDMESLLETGTISPITPGEGEGPHDANAKKNAFLFDDAETVEID